MLDSAPSAPALLARGLALGLVTVTLGFTGAAAAQSSTTSDVDATRTGTTEGPDRTRLDVERLPPEAIPIQRSLYAHGFYVEGVLGARGYVGGVGNLSTPGPYFGVRLGYEVLDWLWIGALAAGSMHQTNAPAPPATQVFELFDVLGDVRLQVNPTAELALWLGGQAGMTIASTDVLRLYGQPDASSVGLAYGGELGIDLHFHARHLSLGALGGARLAPSLDVRGSTAIGVHGGLTLRYVF